MFGNPRKKIIISFIATVAVFMLLLASCANNRPINRFKNAIEDGYFRTAQAVFEETTDPQFFDEAEYYIRDKADEALASFAQGESDFISTRECLSNYESFFDMTNEKIALETISESKKFYWNAKEAENEQDYPYAVQSYEYVSSLDTENYDAAQQAIENIRSKVADELIVELNKYKEIGDFYGAESYIGDLIYSFFGSDGYYTQAEQFVGEDVYQEAVNIIEETRRRYYAKEIEYRISAIGTVTLNSSRTIASARKLYDSYEDDPDIQEEVSNYDILVDAEQELYNLQIEDAEKAISAIGTVTLSSADAIKTARKVYNSYSSEIKNAVNNYSVLTDAEKKIEELQTNDALKKAEDYVAKGDYANAIKSLDNSISKLGNSTLLSARRDSYADSYVKETISAAAAKYKQYDYNALMSAEKVLETALKVLPNEKQLKDKLAYYRALEPIPLAELSYSYSGFWPSLLKRTGSQTSVSGYVYDYTLGPDSLSSYDYSINTMTFHADYQYSMLTGKFFFNEKYKAATSEEVSLEIETSTGSTFRKTFKNDGKTYSFEINLAGAKSFTLYLEQTSDLTDLAFLADMYLWK